MRKKNRLKHVLCLVFLMGTVVSAQADEGSQFIPTNLQGYYFSPQNLGLATPQTAEFVQYGNIPMNLYNGLLNLDIPLLDYKDPAFELDFSVKYLSDGFKPGRRPSVVGNNWILNAGGSITRNVVGTPDDIRQDLHPGLLTAIRDGKFKQYSKEDLVNLKIETSDDYYQNLKTEYDMNPDIFEFNFGNHKGKFIIDNTGQAKCLTGGGYKVNLSGMAVQDFSKTNAPAYSCIQITTPDGYLYTFGGGTSYLEYSIPNNPNGLTSRPVQITSWHLASIKNVTGNRTVSFIYESRLQKSKYRLFVLEGYYGHKYTEYRIKVNGTTKPADLKNFNDGKSKHFLLEDKVYTPILKTINVDDISIQFTVETFPTNFYGETTGNDLLYLSNIKMSKGARTIKSCKFDYLTKGKFFFLKKVTLDDLSELPTYYNFDYDLDLEMPDPLTTSTDHWGYWNGKYEAIDQVLTFLGSQEKIDEKRAVNTNVASYAMLKKVTYPTKGEEKIEYEHNRYRFYLTRRKDCFGWDSNQATYDTPFGGVRIKKLMMYDPTTGKTKQRSFRYTHPSTGTECGRINELPRYIMPEEEVKCRYDCPDSTVTTHTYIYSKSCNSAGRVNNISEHPISYSYVTETYDDGSYDRYHFSDMADDSDLHKKLGYYIANFNGRSFTDFQILDKSLNYAPNDLSAFRGKLLSKESYNNRSHKVATAEYEYNFEQRTSNYEVSISNSAGAFISNKIFTTPCLMTQEKLTDENNVTVIHNYEYNDKGIVTQKETVNSNGDHVYLKFVHPGEQKGLYPEENYTGLVNENRIEEPIAVIKYLRKAGESERKIIDIIQFLYKPFEGCGLQKLSLLTYLLPEPLPENTNFGDIGGAMKYMYGIEYYNNYDRYGNLITYNIHTDKEEIIYIWASPTMMAAEIKGSTYKAVKEALGMQPEEYSMNYLDKPELEDLRGKLPNAHITLYEYDPQIGIKHLSDPTKRDSFYQYDRSGRLNKTYRVEENGKLQLMEYNNYHYTE